MRGGAPQRRAGAREGLDAVDSERPPSQRQRLPTSYQGVHNALGVRQAGARVLLSAAVGSTLLQNSLATWHLQTSACLRAVSPHTDDASAAVCVRAFSAWL